MQAAQTAGVRRAVAQSIAFIYAPGEGMRDEDDPLDLAADGVRQSTVQGIVTLEHEVLATAGIDGVALRYGYFYGPDTWYGLPPTILQRTATSCRARRRNANWASIRRSGCPDGLSAGGPMHCFACARNDEFTSRAATK
jgi:nucleoside-diphosphate-sugar epimerase